MINSLGIILSADECSEIIKQAETNGWGPSNINKLYAGNNRLNSKISANLGELFERIADYVPKKMNDLNISGISQQFGESSLLCYKYNVNDYFALHTDGVIVREDGAESVFSMVIYLNDDFEGGQTVFPEKSIEIQPETGKIIIFNSDEPHLSEMIKTGCKYIIETAIMYK